MGHLQVKTSVWISLLEDRDNKVAVETIASYAIPGEPLQEVLRDFLGNRELCRERAPNHIEEYRETCITGNFSTTHIYTRIEECSRFNITELDVSVICTRIASFDSLLQRVTTVFLHNTVSARLRERGAAQVGV